MTIHRPHPHHVRLSPQQQRVLDFIDRDIAEGRGFPSVAAIARFMEWKREESARDCLHKLRWRGLVRIDRDYKWQRVSAEEGYSNGSKQHRCDADAR